MCKSSFQPKITSPVYKAVEIAIGITGGLEFLHSRRIIKSGRTVIAFNYISAESFVNGLAKVGNTTKREEYISAKQP